MYCITETRNGITLVVHDRLSFFDALEVLGYYDSRGEKLGEHRLFDRREVFG